MEVEPTGRALTTPCRAGRSCGRGLCKEQRQEVTLDVKEGRWGTAGRGRSLRALPLYPLRATRDVTAAGPRGRQGRHFRLGKSRARARGHFRLSAAAAGREGGRAAHVTRRRSRAQLSRCRAGPPHPPPAAPSRPVGSRSGGALAI